MKLRRDCFDIMCQVNPQYKQHLRHENGKKVLYLLVLWAIYGYTESALLWYKILSIKIEGLGFEINPDDRRVSNRKIEGTQCTIAWYVYDNKMSHKNPELI